MKKKINRKKRIRRTLITISLILFSYAVLLFAVSVILDRRHAELELIGSKEITIEFGTEYLDEGAEAFSRGEIFGQWDTPIDVSAHIPKDMTELGTYEIVYRCTYLKTCYEISRTVTVVDTQPPVIELEHSPEFNSSPVTGYVEPGYHAYDNHDGDITDCVTVTINGDTVLYTVSDLSGNTSETARAIVCTPSEPQIILNEGNRVELPAAISFTDPGFRAFDGQGVEVSDKVDIDGEVIPYLPGEYELTYRLDLGNDNFIEEKRIVTVTAAEIPASKAPEEKTIYLTFDDGPGPYTEKLLDILEKYNVKATFFVTNQNPEYMDIITREYNEGHTVAVHTASHDYGYIYSGVEQYYEDFMEMREIIYEKTGYYSNMFRFPGGSSNTISSFTPGIITTLSQAMPAMGFKYYDWNVSSGDAGGTTKTSKVVENVISGIEENYYDYSVVLQHDIHEYSVDAVEQIIIWGLENGYRFAALDMTAPTTRHAIAN